MQPFHNVIKKKKKIHKLGILCSVHLNNVLIMIHKFKHENKYLFMINWNKIWKNSFILVIELSFNLHTSL